MSLDNTLNKLAKWRKFFASWQLGTTLENDGEYRAVADQRELLILLRAEVSALISVLVRKGVITEPELQAAVERAARDLDKSYEQAFPGFSTSLDGLHMKMPQALETMKRMGFPD